MRDRQLDLFDAPADAPSAQASYPGALHRLAEQLPPHVHLGTSSWTFPGWTGLVYLRRYDSQASFVRESLAEYARHPLFKTVGVDRAHYAPLSREDWLAYARQLPSGFRCVIKVWDELTVMTFPDHPRYGARRGQTNASFLDSALFKDAVLGPLREGFAPHVAALVLEFAPMRRCPPARVFADKLAQFLEACSSDVPLAVELRNRELFTPRYLAILRHFGASHVLSFWTGMPTLREQLAVPGVLCGPLTVARLSLPPFTAYAARNAARKQEFSPFDRIIEPQPALREDVVELARRTAELNLALFVTVNNKVEGSAPLTIAALAERIIARAL
jgi:uncharacterized protein YecE (DUF72 family)